MVVRQNDIDWTSTFDKEATIQMSVCYGVDGKIKSSNNTMHKLHIFSDKITRLSSVIYLNMFLT